MARGVRFNYDNDVKKSAKYIAKSSQLYLQRDDENVLICGNGHYIIKVEACYYDRIIRLASPRFIQLSSGDKATASQKDELPVIHPDGFDLLKCWKSAESSSGCNLLPIEVTPYVIEHNHGKGGKARVFSRDGEFVYIDEEIWQNFQIFVGVNSLWNDGSKPPVYTMYERGYTGAMFLPVNIDNDANRFYLTDRQAEKQRMTA